MEAGCRYTGLARLTVTEAPGADLPHVVLTLALYCPANAKRNSAITKNEILINLSESDHTKFGKEEFAAQSVPQKVFSSVWAVAPGCSFANLACK